MILFIIKVFILTLVIMLFTFMTVVYGLMGKAGYAITSLLAAVLSAVYLSAVLVQFIK